MEEKKVEAISKALNELQKVCKNNVELIGLLNIMAFGEMTIASKTYK